MIELLYNLAMNTSTVFLFLVVWHVTNKNKNDRPTWTTVIGGLTFWASVFLWTAFALVRVWT